MTSIPVPRGRRGGLLCALLLLLITAAAPATAAAASSTDWPQYLHGPQHSSTSLATAITPATAPALKQLWHWKPGTVSGLPAPRLDGSPTVVGSRVYIGATSGVFYALDATRGTIVWKRTLDVQPSGTCAAARGITATAAVVNDPVSGAQVVYAAGARYLYALNATSGAQIWKTRIGPADPSGQSGHYNWSSPTVVAGHVYMGLASRCDTPLIRGGVVELDQHTGKVLHTWYTVPSGSIGGSVWSSVAVSSDGADVWVSTGNECDPTVNTCPAGNQIGDSLSIVHLSGSLARLEGWQAPGTAGSGQDSDFGSLPTLFGAGSPPADVGSCNKNGIYYALGSKPLSAAPIWSDTIGAPANSLSSCLASAVWNGPAGTLFIAGDQTTVGGSSYGGSIRRVDPATGAFLWQLGLPCSVMGTPSSDSAGVLAVATYNACTPSTSKPAAYLVDASSGAILKTLSIAGGRTFAQPVFAGSSLYVATEASGLYAFG